MCEHVSQEPDLTLSKEVQQQLLASACGILFFFPLSLPRSCAAKSGSHQRSALALSPSPSPSLLAKTLNRLNPESWAPYFISPGENGFQGTIRDEFL